MAESRTKGEQFETMCHPPGEPLGSSEDFPVIVIAGPTGSGKSALAITLAERFGGEIVNCDSVQLYKGFDIGAAKLPVEEWRGIPHHLFDVAGPGHDFTAGEYSRCAREVLAAIAGRHKLPIVCGGSGFYLRALISGLSPAPLRNEPIRARLTKIAHRHPGCLHKLLKRKDPVSADRIHPNDLQKLIRAVEMALLAGAAPSKVQAQPRNELTGYRVLTIGLEPYRTQLYDRLNARTAAMFDSGLICETNSLLRLGYTRESKPMQSLGYAQALRVLSGEWTVKDAVVDCQTRTRQYAKRQMTWFRREPGIRWLHGFGTEPHVVAESIALLDAFLKR